MLSRFGCQRSRDANLLGDPVVISLFLFLASPLVPEHQLLLDVFVSTVLLALLLILVPVVFALSSSLCKQGLGDFNVLVDKKPASGWDATAPFIISRGLAGLDIIDWRLRIFDGLALKFSDGVYRNNIYSTSDQKVAWCPAIAQGCWNTCG